MFWIVFVVVCEMERERRQSGQGHWVKSKKFRSSETTAFIRWLYCQIYLSASKNKTTVNSRLQIKKTELRKNFKIMTVKKDRIIDASEGENLEIIIKKHQELGFTNSKWQLSSTIPPSLAGL